MANIKISELPAAASVTTTDILVVNQGTDTKKATVAQALAGTLTTANIAGLSTLAPAALATSPVVGLSTFAARADHQHEFPTATQVGALGATAAAGGDLTGNYPNPTLAAVTTAQTNVGSASVIPVLSIDAKGRVTALSTAQVGALTTSQIAGLATTAPAALATAPVVGLSTFAARADHQHQALQTNVQVFDTVTPVGFPAIWTKPAGAKLVVVEMVSGGNGGGAGGKGTSGTAIYGGTGGGGGGYSRTTLNAADLADAPATYDVTVGAGGAGAIFGVSTAQLGGISGFAPTSAPTAFLARCNPGGQPGANGGTTAPAAGSGGAPNSNAGGGTSISATAASGSGSANAPGGGGGGGGISATPSPFNGGNGAVNPFINLFSASGGQSSSASGGNATASIPRSGVPSLIMNGSAGGGGGASTFASGNGGNGANATGYGHGGGGGGATIGSGNGGNGGNGAQGCVVITTYF